MHWLLLLLLLSAAPTASAPVAATPVTVFPPTGMSRLWMSLQRVLATYPKEDVQQQLKKLMSIVAKEAYQQHVDRNPGVVRPIII